MNGIWGHLRHNGKKVVIPTFPGMARSMTTMQIYPDNEKRKNPICW